MKNKIIVSLTFILPLIIYFVLVAMFPDKTTEAIAKVSENNMPKVIVFSTPMCGECKKMAPLIEKAKKNYSGKVEILKLNAVENNLSVQQLCREHNIQVVPTIVYINKDGKVIQRTEGSLSYEELEQYINKVF